jgi:hypothetical protein
VPNGARPCVKSIWQIKRALGEPHNTADSRIPLTIPSTAVTRACKREVRSPARARLAKWRTPTTSEHVASPRAAAASVTRRIRPHRMP